MDERKFYRFYPLFFLALQDLLNLLLVCNKLFEEKWERKRWVEIKLTRCCFYLCFECQEIGYVSVDALRSIWTKIKVALAIETVDGARKGMAIQQDSGKWKSNLILKYITRPTLMTWQVPAFANCTCQRDIHTICCCSDAFPNPSQSTNA